MIFNIKLHKTLGWGIHWNGSHHKTQSAYQRNECLYTTKPTNRPIDSQLVHTHFALLLQSLFQLTFTEGGVEKRTEELYFITVLHIAHTHRLNSFGSWNNCFWKFIKKNGGKYIHTKKKTLLKTKNSFFNIFFFGGLYTLRQWARVERKSRRPMCFSDCEYL